MDSYYEYYERSGDKIDVFTRHNYTDRPPDHLLKKYKIMNSFKIALLDSLQLDTKKSIPTSSTSTGTGIMEVPGELSPPSQSVDESCYLPFVKKWTSSKLAHLFRLNNKLIQVKSPFTH
jgi:hypothetical protein